jgi:hypothetical protein
MGDAPGGTHVSRCAALAASALRQQSQNVTATPRLRLSGLFQHGMLYWHCDGQEACRAWSENIQRANSLDQARLNADLAACVDGTGISDVHVQIPAYIVEVLDGASETWW